MSQAKVTESQFIDFLIATAMEAARTQPATAQPAAHDADTRRLHRLEPTSDTLWSEAKPEVQRSGGALVLDDSVLDKPYARHMDLVHSIRSYSVAPSRVDFAGN